MGIAYFCRQNCAINNESDSDYRKSVRTSSACFGEASERGEALQRAVLEHLISTAKDTEYGRNHDFAGIKGYDDFMARVPVNTYEELKGDIDRMRQGEADILWPGRVKWYAKSSGTTNDKSKFIPVSNEGLQKIHYAGGRDSVALYLRNNPKSRMFDGKGLILGGSHAPNYNLPDSLRVIFRPSSSRI